MTDTNKIIEELKKKIKIQEQEILNLKEQIYHKDKLINTFPQLSATSFGHPTSDGKITIRNWFVNRWSHDDYFFCDNVWLVKYFKHYFSNVDYKLNIFGIYGDHDDVISKDLDGKKIFFTPEDLRTRYFHFSKKFGYYGLKYMDFSLGFDLIDHPHYLRFPYWITRNFNPESTEEDIENRIEYLNTIEFEKTKNVALVASHDEWNTRTTITNDIEKITSIDYAGSWRHNNSDLQKKFGDNKVEFLKQYKFNICAENGDSRGYITEKIFEAFQANCIPLYIGGGDYMEPKVLNKNAILLWDMKKDNSDTVELFKTLLNDEKSFKEFKEQNPLLDTSSKFVIKKFAELKKHCERIIYD